MNRAEDLSAELQARSVPTLVAVLLKLGYATRFIHGLTPADPRACTFAGRAFTIRTVPSREDFAKRIAQGEMPNPHRRAVAKAEAGDVIVFATGGETRVSLIGDIIALDMKRRGIAGVVLECGVGDIQGVADVGLPAFSAGSAPVPGGTKLQVVEDSVPVGIGGVAIYPGDYIVGDPTGLVCVPGDVAATVNERARDQNDLESFLVEQIRNGAPLETTYPPDSAMLARYEEHRRMR